MDNEQKILGSVPKKKGKRYIIILVLIILGLASYIVYDKVIKNSIDEKSNEKEDNNTIEQQNSESEEEKGYTNLNSELKNVLTFNILQTVEDGDKLVAVTRDGKEILLADLTEYNSGVRYDFYNDKIYLSLHKSTPAKQEKGVVTVQPVHYIYLAYIDLNQGNGNYKVNIITEINSAVSPESIAATSDALYIASCSRNMEVKKYSLTENKFEDMDISGKDYCLTLDSTKDGSNYLVYNIGLDLYLLDTSTNESKILENKSQLAFIYNGKIVYYKKGTTEVGKLIYSEYDIKTGVKEILSPEVGYGSAGAATENIMPYKDGYIYFTESKVMSYNKGNYRELFDYSDIGFIYGTSRRGRVSEEEIYLGFAGMLMEKNPVQDALGTKTIGLEDNNVEETSVYYDYRYTKYYEQNN